MFQPDFSQGKPAVAWADYLQPQDWPAFSVADHRTWDTLFERQMAFLDGRIVTPFFEGVDRLGLSEAGIPELERLSDRLEAATGWRLVSVAGIVPDAAFFAMLAARRFPIGNFIRSGDSLDYLEQPDCFHDIFGHVPLLASAPVAAMMESLGRLGVAACAAGQSDIVSRLYWHSVEFGLVMEAGACRILGAGLASSAGEARHALEGQVDRPPFTTGSAARTAYRSDAFQPLYFVSPSLDDVARTLGALTLDDLGEWK